MTPTILVVDDADAVRTLLCRVLDQEGFRVLEASTPQTACEIFDHEPGIDLLVTDVKMPDMSGAQLAARLVNKRPGLPVLFISGYSQPQEIEAHHGSARFLQKPFGASLLFSSIAELLSNVH